MSNSLAVFIIAGSIPEASAFLQSIEEESLCYDIYMKVSVRLIYLYLFSFVGLIIVVTGSVQLVNLGLKVFVFPESDRYDYTAPPVPGEKIATADAQMIKDQAARDQTRNRQRDLSNAVAMIAVGLPLYLYHWKTIQKENNKK